MMTQREVGSTTGHGEGHGRPETGPPGGMVELLERWERSGGHWRIVSLRENWIALELLTCDGGESVSRVSGARTSVLRSYLAGRNHSTDPCEGDHSSPPG